MTNDQFIGKMVMKQWMECFFFQSRGQKERQIRATLAPFATISPMPSATPLFLMHVYKNKQHQPTLLTSAGTISANNLLFSWTQ
jgi:hypothetical protein